MSNPISEYLFIAIALFCIIRGIMSLKTGKLPQGEARWTQDLSVNGLKKYTKLSSALDIAAGVVCIVICVVKLMGIVETDLYRIILVAVCVVLLTGIVLIRQVCRNTK